MSAYRCGTLLVADLFCGAGGTSTGAVQAATELGYRVELTAVNHWPIAVESHQANHPETRHVCAAVDSLNPRHLFPGGRLDLLWASPECTHHSRARGGRPMSDQSRASAHCVTRWAEALRPGLILVENVAEFLDWGPLDNKGYPIQSRKGSTFRAWVGMLESLGYKVDWRILCAADYGDPTTRRRLFVQAVLGRRRIRWPEPTHAEAPSANNLLPDSRARWRAAREIIDWSIQSQSIFGRKRPLSANTIRRIWAGLRKYAGACIVPTAHHGDDRCNSLDSPLPTVAGNRGDPALVEPFLISMEHGGRTLSIDTPINTITTAKGGAHALVEPFLVKYFNTATARPVSEPLDTLTTKHRFGLVQPEVSVSGKRHLLDIRFRMLQPHELAAAQGFPAGYRFSGTKTEVVRQIGNAVPCGIARCLVRAALDQ